jgi:hypothetical protein
MRANTRHNATSLGHGKVAEKSKAEGVESAEGDGNSATGSPVRPYGD